MPLASDAGFAQLLVTNLRRQQGGLAVSTRHGQWTHQELDVASQHLAGQLRAIGVASGDRVVSLFGKSLEFVAGFTACLRLGATFVPFDVRQGREFVRAGVTAAQPTVILAPLGEAALFAPGGTRVLEFTASSLMQPAETTPSEAPAPQTSFPSLILFTSGTTGTPKGVMITDENIRHYTLSLTQRLGLDSLPPLGFGYVSSVGADLGNTCLFGALFTGGTLHIIDEDSARDPLHFRQWLLSNPIDVLKITPSHFQALWGRAEGASPRWEGRAPLRYLIFGGEALSVTLARSVLAGGIAETVVNHYGPTETTVGVFCTSYTLSDLLEQEGETLPIGTPLGQTRFELIPTGEGEPAQGELQVAGPSVTAGYFNAPELTGRRFIVRPDATGTPTRFYKTGDLCRLLPNGLLRFEGRIDRQLKIAGLRIEPEAVENALASHPGISRAAVWAEHRASGATLVAAIECPEDAPAISDETIAMLVSRQAPSAAVPTRIHRVKVIPNTPNGKIDLQLLQKELAGSRPNDTPPGARNPGEVEPRGGWSAETLRATMVRLIGRELPVPAIDLDKSFFAQGGDSLTALIILGNLQRLDLPVDARLFFSAESIGALCERVWERVSAPESSPADVPPSIHTAPATLQYSALQQWFYAQRFTGDTWWNQAIIVRCNEPLRQSAFSSAVKSTLSRHAVFLTRYASPTHEVPIELISRPVELLFLEVETYKAFETKLAELTHELHTSLRPTEGLTVRFAVVSVAELSATFIVAVAHHLVVDGLSWRILFDELCQDYLAFCRDSARPSASPPEFVYFKLAAEASSGTGRGEFPRAYEETLHQRQSRALPTDRQGDNLEGSSASIWISLTEHATRTLESSTGSMLEAYLMAAFFDAVSTWSGLEGFWLDTEHHGRPLQSGVPGIAQAVGWFTALTPIWLERCRDFMDLVAATKSILSVLPEDRQAYGQRFLASRPHDRTEAHAGTHLCPELVFNYLGRFHSPAMEAVGWQYDTFPAGPARDPRGERLYKLKLTGRLLHNRLLLDLSYSENLYAKETIRRIAELLATRLGNILDALGDRDGTTERFRFQFDARSTSGVLTYCPRALAETEPHRPTIVAARRRNPARVLLTGATGFLGSHVLGELLRETSSEIYCLSRDQHPGVAFDRLVSALTFYGFKPDLGTIRQRVRLLLGDISQPGFGLPAETLRDLQKNVDDVIHTAANVTLFGQAAVYDAVNIGGVRHAIDFVRGAQHARLHHVSTLAVAGINRTGSRRFAETDFAYGQDFHSPYEESKFKAESLVRDFLLHGGRAKIFRTGHMSAHSTTGTFQSNISHNRVYQTLKTYVDLKLAPNLPGESLAFSNVDVVAKGLVRLALETADSLQTFHLETQHTVPHNEVIKALQDFGFDVSMISPEEFADHVGRLHEQGSTTAAFASLWVLQPLKQPRNVTFDSSWTLELLRKVGVEFSHPTSDWLHVALRHCVERGFLSHPQRTR